MSTMIKSIKRIQQENSKKVIYSLIEKIQSETFTEEQIEAMVEESMLEMRQANKSQRGKSGYNIFVKEKSAEMKENSTEKIQFKEISKKIGEMWKNMSEDEKDMYRQKAKDMPAETKKICSGTKGDGTACSNKVKTDSKFCGQHLPKQEKDTSDENKCKAKTAKGNPCTRNACDGQDLCKMHIAKSTKPKDSAEKQTCQGLSKSKEPCKRKAALGDYCKKHAEVYGFKSLENGEAEVETTTTTSYPKIVKIGTDSANLITYKGKQYYLGEDDNVCYNAATHAEVGFWDADEETIIYN